MDGEDVEDVEDGEDGEHGVDGHNALPGVVQGLAVRGRTATTDNATATATATATTDTWDRFKFFDRLRICDKFLIWIYLIYLLLPRSCVHGPAPSRRSCLQRTCRRCSWSS